MKDRSLLGLAGLAAAVVLAASSLAACGDKYQEPFKDAPRNGTDRGAAVVIEMPDGFSNAATKCLTIDGKFIGIRITTAYHGDNKYGAISTVADPTCK